MLFYVNSILAQDKNNQWQVSFGSSAVDFVNEGTNVIANKRANVDTWNYKLGTLNSISLSRYSDEHFNYGFKGSFNAITTMGDGSGTSVDKLLTSIDVYTEYNLGDSFSFWNIHPFTIYKKLPKCFNLGSLKFLIVSVSYTHLTLPTNREV